MTKRKKQLTTQEQATNRRRHKRPKNNNTQNLKSSRPPPPAALLETLEHTSFPQLGKGNPQHDFFNAVQVGNLKVGQVKEKEKKDRIEMDNPHLPQPPFLMVVVAPRKSGKTFLVIDSLLDDNKYCKKFDVIIIWSRTFQHDSKWKNIQVPPGSVFTVFNEYEVKTMMSVAEKVAAKTTVNALFIFDDMISEGIMSHHKMGTLESIAVRGRHANVSLLIITQQYMALSASVRNNATNSIFFRIRNGDELEKVARENRESLKMDQFLELYNFATREPYAFLHINNQEPDPSKRFWKNWDTCLTLQ
jgi:Poxvirus A32 protein